MWHECQQLHLPTDRTRPHPKKSFQHGFAAAFKKPQNEALRAKLSEWMDTSQKSRVEKLPAHLYILDGGDPKVANGPVASSHFYFILDTARNPSLPAKILYMDAFISVAYPFTI
jgi:hypothetical protein